MRRRSACVLLIIMLAAGSAAAAAAPKKSAGIMMDKYAVTADRFEGILGGPGPGEWSGNVTITGDGAKVTCDRVKVWLAADGRHIERAEASGHIVLQGRYVAADETEWKVVGTAETAAYEREAAEGTLEGSVEFTATNQTTGAVVSVTAEKLIYDIETRHFRFERGERQVQGKWDEPEAEEKAAAGPEQPPSGKGGSD